MTSYSATARTGGMTNWLRRPIAWLDSRGRGAWIGAMVLGFIFVWPIGFALLFYITLTNRWSKDMFGNSFNCAARRHEKFAHFAASYRPSGNSAFDAYKVETLRRLEEEQAAFEGFLQRLREAKDKTEFDTFMDDRAKSNRPVEPAEVARPGEY